MKRKTILIIALALATLLAFNGPAHCAASNGDGRLTKVNGSQIYEPDTLINETMEEILKSTPTPMPAGMADIPRVPPANSTTPLPPAKG